MKKLLFIIALFTCLQASAQQKVKVDANGNFITALASKTPSISTGKTFTTGGTTYPVYKSTTGKYFIIRKSKKTGKEYKYYLTVQ